MTSWPIIIYTLCCFPFSPPHSDSEEINKASNLKDKRKANDVQPSPTLPKKRKQVDEIDGAIIRSLDSLNQRHLSRSVSDEEELFGKTVAANLRRLTPRQKAMAKLRIQTVLTEIEFPEQ